MTQQLRYIPTTPATVASVTRLQLYTDAGRTAPAVVDVGPATPSSDGSWGFHFADLPAASYWPTVTLTRTDTTVDTDDLAPMALPVAAVEGAEPLASWVTDPSTLDAPDASPAQKITAASFASQVLWALSGRRWWGQRQDRLRVAPDFAGLHVPFPSSFSLWTPGRTRGCPCHASTINPQVPGPVIDVVSLTVGDVVVPHDQIEIEDRRVIRVAPGADSTTDPLAVNLWVDEDGFYALFPNGACGCGRRSTVDMILEWGSPPPDAGAEAARLLATEVAKGLSGDTSCRIAGNVTSVNRQGVSVLLDPATFLDEGRTGVPLVDLWLTSVNPNKLQRPPEVWWPEVDTPTRLETT